jgi:hypothetical protein
MGIGSAIGGIVGGIASSRASSKAADAQVEAAQMQTELERDIYNDTVERFEPYYDGGLDYNNALRYELLGGPAPTFGGTAPEITTRTVGGGGGGGQNQFAGMSPVAAVNDITFNQRTNSGSQKDWALGNMLRNGGNSGGSRTEYMVGDNVFQSLEDAQAWAKANPVGGYEYQGFEATPGYNFALEQGQTAIDGSAAARGNVFSGATLKAQQEFGTGLAQQEYGNYLNRLTGQASQGQAAAGNIATAGSNYASGAGNALANMGNAQAAGYVGQANALNGAINSGLSAWGYMNQPQTNSFTASNGVAIPMNTFNSVQALF